MTKEEFDNWLEVEIGKPEAWKVVERYIGYVHYVYIVHRKTGINFEPPILPYGKSPIYDKHNRITVAKVSSSKLKELSKKAKKDKLFNGWLKSFKG